MDAGGGEPSPGRRVGIRPDSLRTSGTFANTGALAASPPGTATRLACTGLRAINAVPDMAEMPPGAVQLTYRAGGGPFGRTVTTFTA